MRHGGTHTALAGVSAAPLDLGLTRRRPHGACPVCPMLLGTFCRHMLQGKPTGQTCAPARTPSSAGGFHGMCPVCASANDSARCDMLYARGRHTCEDYAARTVHARGVGGGLRVARAHEYKSGHSLHEATQPFVNVYEQAVAVIRDRVLVAHLRHRPHHKARHWPDPIWGVESQRPCGLEQALHMSVRGRIKDDSLH